MNIGNPAIWWAFIPAIIVALLILLLKRDWRFLVRCWLYSVRAISVVYVPDSHDVLFHALSFEPFLILLLAGFWVWLCRVLAVRCCVLVWA